MHEKFALLYLPSDSEVFSSKDRTFEVNKYCCYILFFL